MLVNALTGRWMCSSGFIFLFAAASAAVGHVSGANPGDSRGRASLAVDGNGVFSRVPTSKNKLTGADDTTERLATAAVSPSGHATLYDLPTDRMGSLVEPLGEGLSLVASAVESERRRAKGDSSESDPAVLEQEWAKEESASKSEDSNSESGSLDIAGASTAGTGASIRREPPPPRGASSADFSTDTFPQQAALASQSEVGMKTQGSDTDLASQLVSDAEALMRQARWHLTWRMCLAFLGSICLGLVIGAVIGVVTGANKATDNSGVATGRALLCLGLLSLLCCIIPAIYIVGDVLNNLEMIGGQMLNFAVTHMGVDMLARISELETNSSIDDVTWVVNLANPSDDAIKFNRILGLVSMNDASLMLFKSKPLPTEFAPRVTGPLPLGVLPNPGNVIRKTFEALTREGREWTSTFARQSYAVSIEGEFRKKDFSFAGTCELPLRLADLPMPSGWPTGLDRATVERSFAAGLADMHSESGTLVSLPGRSMSVLNYETLEVTGPLVVWFTWLMVFITSMAMPASLCLSFGGMKMKGVGSAGEEEVSLKKANEADAGASPPAEQAEGTPAAAEGTPAAAGGRSARSRAPQAKAPPPAPAPAGGGEDDEHEF